MEIRITDSLKLQCEIPFVLIEKFQFVWEPNQHAVLGLEGYINGNAQYITDKLYDSKIKIWKAKQKGTFLRVFNKSTRVRCWKNQKSQDTSGIRVI